MSSNIKPKTRRQGIPDRAVQARGRGLHARDRAQARSRNLLCGGAPRHRGRQGAAARAAAQAQRAGRRDRARARGLRSRCKLACHDPAVHRRQMPGGQQARAVFEAVEQARVEAIGARRMHGVAQNLSAMLDDKFHRGKFDDITDRADAPIEEAVAMMVRERLTGQAPPPAARKLVDLWRPFIEDRAGARSRPAGEAGREPAPLRRRRCTTCSTRSRWATSARATPTTRARTIPARTTAAEPGRGRRGAGVRGRRRA